MNNFAIQRLCIIGVGLIGGSLGMSLKKSGYCSRITGTGRSQENLDKAVEMGAIDEYDLDMSAAVKGADMVLVAVPVASTRAVFEQIQGSLGDNTVVTDVGSTKLNIVSDANEALGRKFSRFVPGHPIAGTEKSGVSAAFPSLYENCRVILTPSDQTGAGATRAVSDMWMATGAIVETMSAKHHDMVLAATSHLPHMLAFGLVDCLNNVEDIEEIFRFAAGGFSDFTRIASSDPVMWRDVCLSNRDALLIMMKRYQVEMNKLCDVITASDADALLDMFTRAKSIRDNFIQYSAVSKDKKN